MNEEQMKLLKEAAEHMGDMETSPAPTWWKRYFQHVDTSAHMVLTDEGWEPASGYMDVAEDDLPDFKDEVNAPKGKALMGVPA